MFPLEESCMPFHTDFLNEICVGGYIDVIEIVTPPYSAEIFDGFGSCKKKRKERKYCIPGM